MRRRADAVETTRPHLIVASDAAAVAQAGARLWVDSVRAALAARGAFHVALAGGSTPATLHRAVAEQPDLDFAWHRTHIWFGDERAVPPDDARSNYHSARKSLLDAVPLPEDQVHRMRGEAGDLAAEAARYAAELASALADGTPGLPMLDLVWLGLGEDGHTASLFPGSAALTVADRAACAVTDASSEPARRLTLTLPVFAAARRVVFVVTGGAKARAVASVLEPPAGTPLEQLPPAARIRPAPGRLLWLIDEAAAARLERTLRAHAAGSAGA
jgi:6-phosphogluconolactonase